jgi:hypothetical protein
MRCGRWKLRFEQWPTGIVSPNFGGVLARVDRVIEAGHFRSCAGFRTPAWRAYPRAKVAGVGKAPRHEIAVGEARTVQRALWGFGGVVRGGMA